MTESTKFPFPIFLVWFKFFFLFTFPQKIVNAIFFLLSDIPANKFYPKVLSICSFTSGNIIIFLIPTPPEALGFMFQIGQCVLCTAVIPEVPSALLCVGTLLPGFFLLTYSSGSFLRKIKFENV